MTSRCIIYLFALIVFCPSPPRVSEYKRNTPLLLQPDTALINCTCGSVLGQGELANSNMLVTTAVSISSRGQREPTQRKRNERQRNERGGELPRAVIVVVVTVLLVHFAVAHSLLPVQGRLPPSSVCAVCLLVLATAVCTCEMVCACDVSARVALGRTHVSAAAVRVCELGARWWWWC